MFKRLIDWHLEQWKHDKNRKPLLIRGARQVGKTYAIRKFGQSFKHFVEVNFELAKDIAEIFKKDLRPERIVQAISNHLGEKITPGETLLFFDEIQVVPDAILSLRYFYELMPSLHVIAAGSLLDFAIEKVGLPVGRVSSMYMHPMSFIEFLAAKGHFVWIETLLQDKSDVAFTETTHEALMNLVGEYFAIGGMPEIVAEWCNSKNPKECFKLHQTLIDSYRQDFEKYATKTEEKYLQVLFRQIPYFLGEQFQYKRVHGDYRTRELSPCLDLLVKANVLHRIYHSASHGLPLGAQINLNWFKIIFMDVAIAQALLGFDLTTWFSQPGIEFVNRGKIAETFVGQELACYSHPHHKPDLYFWKREARGSAAEVDYVYEHRGQIVPIEVKSGETGSIKSMHLFLEEHPQVTHGVRFWAGRASVFNKIDSRPLYSVVSLAHEDQRESLRSLITST